MMKYRAALETAAKRDRAIREKLAELKALVQKRQSQISQAQRAIQGMAVDVKQKRVLVEEALVGKRDITKRSAENRVERSIDLLGATADLRREQFNQKRNSSTSSAWVQSLPTLPGPLKRSLWYKMHRRRQQIVLRPTFTSLLEDLRKHVEAKHSSQKDGTHRVSGEVIEDELIRAEQSYLLATHPIVPREEKVSSVPSTSAWAEPGKPIKVESLFKSQRNTLTVFLLISLSLSRFVLGSNCPRTCQRKRYPATRHTSCSCAKEPL